MRFVLFLMQTYFSRRITNGLTKLGLDFKEEVRLGRKRLEINQLFTRRKLHRRSKQKIELLKYKNAYVEAHPL